MPERRAPPEGPSMDEHAARGAFEHALATYRQDFGAFFLPGSSGSRSPTIEVTVTKL